MFHTLQQLLPPQPSFANSSPGSQIHRYHTQQNHNYLICDDKGKTFSLKLWEVEDLSGNVQVQVPIQQPEQVTYGLNLTLFRGNVTVVKPDFPHSLTAMR